MDISDRGSSFLPEGLWPEGRNVAQGRKYHVSRGWYTSITKEREKMSLFWSNYVHFYVMKIAKYVMKMAKYVIFSLTFQPSLPGF